MASQNHLSLWLWHQIDSVYAGANNQLTQCLTPSEQARLNKISNPRRRNEYLAGHHLLRCALKHQFPNWAADNHIEHLDSKAPEIKGINKEGINFNLSHSNNIVCCALTTHSQIGVDIEAPSRVRSYVDIAEEYFSPSESTLIAALSSLQQRDEFYRLWTLKESLLKAQRKHIGHEAMKVEFMTACNDEPSQFHSYSLMLEQELYVALSLSAPLLQDLKVHSYHYDTDTFSTMNPPQCISKYRPLM